MLSITFEFVGGPNDGKVEQGQLGEPSDAERHYLFSNHGRVGQRFSVAADYTLQALTGDDKQAAHKVQRHHYVVTDRSQDGQRVWVRAEYVPQEEPLQAESMAGEPTQAEKQSQPSPKPAPPRDLDGSLLVASPRLQDNPFSQTVILLLHHDDDESLGLILNRPTPETVDDFWGEVSEIPCHSKQPVYIGGPASGPVIALHADESSGEVPVAPGVFLAVEKEELDGIVQHDEAPFRLFLGTARWDRGQLEQELDRGVWLTLPATQELVFGAAAEQWRDSLRSYGRSLFRSIGLKHLPDDPLAN